MNTKDELIFELIDDIKYLYKKVVSLRYEILDKYPLLGCEMLHDISPAFFRDNEVYIELINKYHIDPFNDDKKFNKDLYHLKKTGKDTKGNKYI